MIETISSQMVLAGPTPVTDIVGSRGPATVISTSVQPLSDPVVIQLSKTLSNSEKLDPALLSANILRPQAQSISSPINPSTIESFFNFLIILAIIFFFYLFLHEGSQKRNSP